VSLAGPHFAGGRPFGEPITAEALQELDAHGWELYHLTITAEVDIPDDGAEGVLFAHGGVDGGYTLFVQDGHLHHLYDFLGRSRTHIASSRPVPAGRVTLGYEFERTGDAAPREGRGAPGIGRLYIGDEVVGEAAFDVTIPILIGLGGGVTAGREEGSPICDLYRPPFPFTGALGAVTVQVGRDHLRSDSEAAMRIAMARQ
jgi:hypothetical protein